MASQPNSIPQCQQNRVLIKGLDQKESFRRDQLFRLPRKRPYQVDPPPDKYTARTSRVRRRLTRGRREDRFRQEFKEDLLYLTCMWMNKNPHGGFMGRIEVAARPSRERRRGARGQEGGPKKTDARKAPWKRRISCWRWCMSSRLRHESFCVKGSVMLG